MAKVKRVKAYHIMLNDKVQETCTSETTAKLAFVTYKFYSTISTVTMKPCLITYPVPRRKK